MKTFTNKKPAVEGDFVHFLSLASQGCGLKWLIFISALNT